MRKLKIGFASTDWSRSMVDQQGHPVPGGANWVRLQQNRRLMKHETVTGLLVHSEAKGFGVADWRKQAHYNCDIIVLQRLMFRKLVDPITNRRSGGPVILNDVDDWYWGLHEENHAYKLTHPDHNKDENINHYKDVIEASDGLVVSTPFLKTKFSTEFNCKRIDIIENCVSMKDFRTRHHKSRRPKVGWVGSTSHRSGDLELLRGVLDAGSWRVHHSGHVEGAVHFADRVGLARNRVTLTPMHHPLNYARLSFEFDIGLAPITDIPFNRAKSWIKAIEYAAAGIPMVMSNVSEYTRLHNEYGIGRLASTPEEWIDNIYDLTDFKTRSQEGKQVRERVQALDVSTMAKNWDALFDSYM